MHTPPHALFVSSMPTEAAAALAGALADAGRALPVSTVPSAPPLRSPMRGLRGPDRPQWCSPPCACTCSASSSDRPAYRVARGAAAGPADIALVAEWFGAFHDEAQPHAPLEDWHASAERRVTEAEVHVWQDRGAPVAVAAVSAPAAGVARVGPVYTPPGQRRRGYGAAVTVEATAAALAGGAGHVALYTDLANPTSNSIYQAIGYRPDHDAEERSFSDQRRRRSGRTICGWDAWPAGRPWQTSGRLERHRRWRPRAAPASKGEVASQRPWAVRWPGEASLSAGAPLDAAQPSRRP